MHHINSKFFVLLSIAFISFLSESCKTAGSNSADMAAAASSASVPKATPDIFETVAELFPEGLYRGETIIKSDCFITVEGGVTDGYISIALRKSSSKSPTNMPEVRLTIDKSPSNLDPKDYEDKDGLATFMLKDSPFDFEIEHPKTGNKAFTSFLARRGGSPTQRRTLSCSKLKFLSKP